MRLLAFLTLAVASLDPASVTKHAKDVVLHAWAVLDQSLQDGSSDHRQEALAALAIRASGSGNGFGRVTGEVRHS
jgi:hypothetical protein